MFILPLFLFICSPVITFEYDQTIKVGDLVVSRFNEEFVIYQVLEINNKHKHNKNCEVSDIVQKNPVFVLKKIFDDQYNFVANQNKRAEKDPCWLTKLNREYIQERIKRLQFMENFLDDQ